MAIDWPYQDSYPPSLWEPVPPPADGRDSASPGDAFTEPQITAQDALNAAKLTPLGFIANPLTAWTTGQSMSVNTTFLFNWTSTAWQAGAAAVEMQEEPQSEEQATEPDVFDPSQYTVAVVQGYVANHPEETQEVLDREIEGLNRVTLVTWLQERI